MTRQPVVAQPPLDGIVGRLHEQCRARQQTGFVQVWMPLLCRPRAHIRAVDTSAELHCKRVRHDAHSHRRWRQRWQRVRRCARCSLSDLIMCRTCLPADAVVTRPCPQLLKAVASAQWWHETAAAVQALMPRLMHLQATSTARTAANAPARCPLPLASTPAQTPSSTRAWCGLYRS